MTHGEEQEKEKRLLDYISLEKPKEKLIKYPSTKDKEEKKLILSPVKSDELTPVKSDESQDKPIVEENLKKNIHN